MKAVARGGLSECHKEEERKKEKEDDGWWLYIWHLFGKKERSNTSTVQYGSVCPLLLESWQSHEPMDYGRCTYDKLLVCSRTHQRKGVNGRERESSLTEGSVWIRQWVNAS